MTASEAANPQAILHGIRVLDLSRVVSGPYCTMMLAEHGAEVIKIESSGGETSSFQNEIPDTLRTNTMTSLNSSKRSVALNLTTEEGKSALKHLVASADVLVENFHPGIMEELGLSYETLAAISPSLVYASISDSGEPPCCDSHVGDGTSCAVLTRTNDPSLKIPPVIADIFAGITMSFGIMAALRHAEATGKSQFVNVGMHDAILSLHQHSAHMIDMEQNSAAPHADPHTIPAQTLHRGSDAKAWTGVPNPVRFNGAPPPAPHAPSAFGADTQTYLAEPAAAPVSDEAKRAMRNAFGAYPTGVTIVTTRQPDGTPRGFTANSFTSVSLDPPMLLICLAKTAHSCDTFTSATHFTVNILSEDQKDVSGLFASRQADKFEKADWYSGHANMPIIKASLASFICEREKLVDAGDHIILIGRVEDYTTTTGTPLGYHGGAYFSVRGEDPLVNAAARAGGVRIGAVLRKAQEILLIKTPDGALSLPYAPDGKLGHEGLLSWLTEQGLQPDPQNLYAVYEDTTAGKIGIYYHGTMQGTGPAVAEFVPVGAIPFERIINSVERSMLQRYAKEYQHGSFGIYQGNQDTGTVHHLAHHATHTH